LSSSPATFISTFIYAPLIAVKQAIAPTPASDTELGLPISAIFLHNGIAKEAGITRDNLLLRMSEQDWDLVIKVNLKSVFNMTKVLLQHFMRNRSGSIINMASVVGVAGNAGQANYSASKAGIIGFTKSIAQEVGSRNIRCNAIAPGFIETPMTAQLPDEVRKDWMQKIPLRRGGTPDDVANIALFLASELSSYVSGQVINVCGGMRM
jgi:3-oxoacyl-[acyl-carrier protein] reductase